MSTHTINMTPALYEYMLSVSAVEPEVLRRLREETSTLEMARMQISPEQGQFMRLLIGLSGARRALEVGVFTGYSSLCVAMALPPEGELFACDVSEEWTAIARRYWREAGMEERIHLRIAPALLTLQELLSARGPGQFDFAFIDADKPNYRAYFEKCLELVRPGGFIAVDNVLWSGRVAEPGVTDPDTVAIREFNKALSRDRRVEHCIVPIADGLTLARRLR